jgi:hydrogenase expression/formation protein HypC
MCLAIPGKVVEIRDGMLATVDVGGVCREVSLVLVDGVEVGDYVIVHVGYALNRLDPEEAEQTLELFRQVARESGIPWPEAPA